MNELYAFLAGGTAGAFATALGFTIATVRRLEREKAGR